MVEGAVMQEMMRRLLVGLVAAEHVEWKAQSFWELEEVEVRVQGAAAGGVRLGTAREC